MLLAYFIDFFKGLLLVVFEEDRENGSCLEASICSFQGGVRAQQLQGAHYGFVVFELVEKGLVSDQPRHQLDGKFCKDIVAEVRDQRFDRRRDAVFSQYLIEIFWR